MKVGEKHQVQKTKDKLDRFIRNIDDEDDEVKLDTYIDDENNKFELIRSSKTKNNNGNISGLSRANKICYFF